MIGIYGGTFDPVHFGHLRPALDVLQALALEKIHLIPSGIPPHRQAPVAAAAQRLAMLQLAVAGQPDLIVDGRELERSGKSYMIDTVHSLQADFPDKDFCLILGVDAFNAFDSWHEWQALLTKVKLVIAHRPKHEIATHSWSQALRDYVAQSRIDSVSEFTHAPAPAIHFCPVTQLAISSTRIRELFAAGQNVAFLLPAAVIDYIDQHMLYC